MARQILLVRHAHAAAADGSDIERPLSDPGQAEVRALTRIVSGRLTYPLGALVSSAVRTRETWAGLERVSAPPGERVDLRVREALYGGAASDVLSMLADMPASTQTAVVVGHNPAMTDLAWTLHDGTHVPAWEEFGRNGLRPCSVAAFAYDGEWGDLRPGAARMVWTWVPGQE